MFPRNATAPAAILVVDDCPLFLRLVGSILTKAGYAVLSASSPDEAIEIESTYSGRIPLLISDVEMPGIAGPDLAAMLTRRRPGMPVLLMSACHAFHPSHLQHGWRFIPKPFKAQALAGMVRHLLSRRRSDAPVTFKSVTRRSPFSFAGTESFGA